MNVAVTVVVVLAVGAFIGMFLKPSEEQQRPLVAEPGAVADDHGHGGHGHH